MTRLRIEDAFAFMAAGEVLQAVGLLQALATETPAHATVHVLLAQGYERLHRWPEALGAWQAAALLMPDVLVVRQGALRATRVLAALRAMADDGAMMTVGTPTGPHLMPVEDPQAPRPAADDPLSGQTITAETPLAPAAPTDEAAPSGDVPGDAVHVSPALNARRYTPPDEAAVPADLAAFFDETPAETPPAAPPSAGLDLDRLIDQLAQSGPIRPRADLDDLPPPVLEDDSDDLVSETLARIYAGQRQYAQAIRIYERLAEQQPHEAERLRAEADALRRNVPA